VKARILALSGAIWCALAATTAWSIEATWDYAVQMSAQVDVSSPKVTLNWIQDSTGIPNNYVVSRKAPDAASWQTLATLPGTTTSYVDSNVALYNAYEYQVQKVAGGYVGYGYICAGVNSLFAENRGTVVLVVDNTYAANLAAELARLQQDLVGDGWNVVRRDVARDSSVTQVKESIHAVYAADPANVKAVFLFGHVPVAYSGNIVPDGHVPDHQGAWPSDAYYGDMDGNWTDTIVNNTAASSTRNQNVPGDGKFDQSDLPSTVELQVGRVDLANLPGRLVWGGPATFPSELELLRNYLEKDHKFRHRMIAAPARAVIHDSFGIRSGEAFAASGYRSLSALVGPSSVTTLTNKGEWIPMLHQNSYLWAYGCGAGSYSSIGGLGNTGQYQDGITPELVQADIKAIFTMVFGSWLGDWDTEDNIMRAVLATPTEGLTSCWSGRPHWFMHHMGIGEPIGYCARLAQNNGLQGIYRNQVNSAAGQIHIALMGDPTLRMTPVVPPSAFVASPSADGAVLSWNASSDSVLGYHVYRADNPAGPFTRVNSSFITGTTYRDAGQTAPIYMVRAVKLETGSSGSYYNPSQGIFASVGNLASTGSGAGSSSTGGSGSGAGTLGGITPTGPTAADANNTTWVDDALPAGAVSGADGGDSWFWVSSNPAPFSGTVAHQSAAAQGAHQHYFDWASQKLTVAAGDVLYAYAFLDPANPPTELMLQWNDGTWEHRAYWGANSMIYGASGTASRRNVGPLPTVGQWVRLEVPASQVSLEGSTLKGMAFSAFNGKVTWDSAGRSLPGSITPTNTPPATNPPVVITPTTNVVSTVWIEDSLPGGAVSGADGGDAWTWVNSNPTPFAGSGAHQSAAAQGQHQHYFDWANQKLAVATGDVLFAYAYLDSANPPTELMLQWNDGTWEHRAYWGANTLTLGASGSNSRRSMGALPAAGAWTRLQIPASQVGLEGSTLKGMAFTAYGGRVTWDSAGKATASVVVTNQPPITSTNNPPIVSTNLPPSTNIVASSKIWVDDALPSGARAGIDGGDAWTWTSANPAPFSGSTCQGGTVISGVHQHFFESASQTLAVASGDTLFAYVYIDPANPPTELMIQWKDTNWEHRAYWGANSIAYGNSGSNGRRYMGPLPASGVWVRLEVPASQVGLEGSTLNGMSFSLFNGRANWDAAGLVSSTNGGTGAGATNPPPVIVPPDTNSPPVVGDGSSATISVVDDTTLEMPRPGSYTLHILSPTLLELELITTKQPDPAPLTQWDFVSNGQFQAPSTSQFQVKANGQNVAVQGIGFKRRPLYAPLLVHDLRIANCFYLQLGAPLSANQSVQVLNPGGALWGSSINFSNVVNPLRYSPAIHVNQEGYIPNYPKQAMVGYYLGNLGEMDIPASLGFTLVDAATGAQVYQGSLTPRKDVGYNFTPTPYQKVLMADFTSFNTPCEYRLLVPGLGASLPFLIDSGIGMDFARTYALGLYHQRCGSDNKMPFTRHTHNICHSAQVDIPSPASSFAFTWTTLASKNADYASNPRHTAPQLKDEASQLYPFINKGKIDVSKGHHDAGDYSKYTVNTAGLIHYLTFAVDSFPGVADLDNLGLPESGDGISDVLQIAKWEADYISKLQDADGGFYFLVYPRDREYESNVTPDNGDPQVVWPKNTLVTASSVAALAQIASSPLFKRTYPNEAQAYLDKAKLGWQFLMNAIAKYGKDGSYQKITFYGDNFMHDDELAWAACQMFLATGDATAHQKLLEWYNPSDPATFRWGWWRMYESYGRAARSYAFAASSGRVAASQLNADFLAKCQEQVILAAQDHVTRANANAYGTSFPLETKAVNGAGWYFSSERAFDITVAYQLAPRTEFMQAIMSNLNYESGCNPVNVTYITGLGWKRQREIVHQYAQNDRRVLPPGGFPLGNVQDGFPYLNTYKSELGSLCFPSDGASTPNPFYDRWGDTFNVSTEFVNIDQARSLASMAFIAAQGPQKTQPWTPPAGQISVAPDPNASGRFIATLKVPGMDLNGARIVWEGLDQEPAFGLTFSIAPKNSGDQWVEAEAQWPDGRRVVAASSFNFLNPVVNWVDDDLPTGAQPRADGGDAWTWISSGPTPTSGTLAHQSAIAAGQHQHLFDSATSTLPVGVGDVLFAWVYIDPANVPDEIMLQWNDGTWEHRAYWGANKIAYGNDGTTGRHSMGPMPPAGQWVRLQIPASQVALEGSNIKGMAFSAWGGRVTWDAAGRAISSAATAWLQPNVKPGSQGPSIAWNSQLGRSYRVSYKNNLSDPNWTALNDIIASGWQTSIIDSNSSNQRFYAIAANN